MSTLPRRAFGLGALSIVVAGLAACSSSDSGQAASQASVSAAEDTTPVEDRSILFEVTSQTATTADITLTSVDANGELVQEELAGEALPFTRTVDVDDALAVDLSAASIMAQVQDGTDVTVAMTFSNGERLTSTAEWEFATAVAQGDSADMTEETADAGA